MQWRCTTKSLQKMRNDSDKLVGPLGMMPEDALQRREKYDHHALHHTGPEPPTFPPYPSIGSSIGSRPPSYNISLAWDADEENMAHVTPAPKIRRSLSDRWFRRMSEGASSQPDTKLGLRTFYEPQGADLGADVE